MPHPDNVQANLEIQFDKIDKMYANDDLRVFGRDTTRIFKEIDVIRRKQIELATEHIGLESIDDMPPTQRTSGEEPSKRNSAFFSKKEKALKSLMTKLDALGQIMNDFREASDLNPHTAAAAATTNSSSSRRARVNAEAALSIPSDRPVVSNTQLHYSSNENSSNADTPRASQPPQLSIPVFSFDQS